MKPLHIIFLFIGLSMTLYAQNETLSASVAGDTVTIFNYGAHENCAARFTLDLKTNGMLVTLIEEDTVKLKVKCMCNFDLSATASGFPAGKYGVMVYRKYQTKYNYPNDTLVFIGSTAFIIGNSSGSYRLEKTNQSECYQPTNIDLDNFIPQEITLEAYPNPSTASDFILKCSLSKPEHVILKMFDAIGREISALVDEEKSAGNYEFIFQNHNQIPGGIYYCTLVTGTANRTVRIVIEK